MFFPLKTSRTFSTRLKAISVPQGFLENSDIAVWLISGWETYSVCIYLYIYTSETRPKHRSYCRTLVRLGEGDEEGESTPKHRTNVSAYDESTEAQERKKGKHM